MDEQGYVECTYNKALDCQDFYLNRILITQEELISDLADAFETEGVKQDILDYEMSEAAHQEMIYNSKCDARDELVDRRFEY